MNGSISYRPRRSRNVLTFQAKAVRKLFCEELNSRPDFHDETSQPLTLNQSNAGELQAELFAVGPAGSHFSDRVR